MEVNLKKKTKNYNLLTDTVKCYEDDDQFSKDRKSFKLIECDTEKHPWRLFGDKCVKAVCSKC